MSAAPAIVPSARERWERDSLQSVGASELAAILGADPRRGQLAIYAAKIARKLDTPEHAWLAWGRRVEGAILDGYSDKTGRRVEPNGSTEMRSWLHPDQPRLRATPDGLTSDPDGVVEAKAVAYMRREEWAAEPPLHYQIQVQAQMACTGRGRGELVALMWGIEISDPVLVPPNADFMALALEAVARFWWHVENGVPPKADGLPETRAAIRRLWPVDDGAVVTLGAGDVEIADQWEAATMRRRAAEKDEEEQENRLRAHLAAARVGYLPDGSALVCRSSAIPAQLCDCGREIRRGYARRDLRRYADARKALRAAHKEG